MSEQGKMRVRVSVGRTSKGAPSYDCTVELEAPVDGSSSETEMHNIAERVLMESERVDAVLKAKYGVAWE
jgi:hypothetical protein|tara:strand:+ start:1567 stop:1776 length:210 start_codon:yes stop_codon:yes gene_type:complete